MGLGLWDCTIMSNVVLYLLIGFLAYHSALDSVPIWQNLFAWVFWLSTILGLLNCGISKDDK